MSLDGPRGADRGGPPPAVRPGKAGGNERGLRIH